MKPLRIRKRLKDPPVTFCPTAVAPGARSTAEVETFKRTRKQKPKKRMNFVDVTQPKKQPRRRKRIAIYEQEERREAVAYIPDEDTPVRKWTTFSRARTNEKRPRKRNRLKPRKKKTR